MILFRFFWLPRLATCATLMVGLSAPAIAQPVPAAPSAITVAMPDDFPPFVSRTASGAYVGQRIDLWRLWSQRTGIAVTVLNRPWPAVLGMVESGQADVVDLVIETPERRTGLDFGPAYAPSDLTLFYRDEVGRITDLASVRGQTVGVLGRSQCADMLRDTGVTTQVFPSMQSLIYSAIVNHLPVFCLQSAPAEFLLSRAGMREDYRATDPVFTGTLHWAVPKGNAALRETLTDGFRQITATEVATIAARWSGPPGQGIFGLEPAQVRRTLGVLAVFLLAALATAAVMRWRLGHALTERDDAAALLRQRIREQTCLHQVFLATDNMQRPMPDILRDIAAALRSGWPDPVATRVRIELMGFVHDDIGDHDTPPPLTAPIMIEGTARGRLDVMPPPDSPATPGCALLLGLAASRIAGRALGQSTLTLLQKSEERFRRTFQHSAQATAVIQNGHFVSANRAALAMLGYGPDQTFVGLTPAQISPATQPDGEASETKASRYLATAIAEGSLKYDWEHLRRDGEPVLIEVLVTVVEQEAHVDFFVLWNDVTVKRQAEAALAAYQQTLEAQVAQRTRQLTTLNDELQAIFNTATAGIALVRDGHIVACNPSLAQILLWPHDQVAGRSTRVFFRDDTAWQTGRSNALAQLAAGSVYEQTEELVRLDGSFVWVRMRATSVERLNPEMGTVWVLEDITAEHAAQAQLAEARDIAVQAARLKSEFLAHMSHELRAPINAVLGFTELLMGTDLAEHQRDFLTKVQASGRHLLLIVNDVLDLSKVEAGKLRIEHTPFVLSSLLRSAVDTVAKGVADKNIELLIDCAPDVPRRLIGDPLRVSQILMNYLGNALKFTQTGTITLSVTREQGQDATAQQVLRFAVTDSGIGMSEDQLGRMFQSFSQAEDSTTRLYGGTGLGLSICRQIAELMHGTVGVSSTAGVGTTFWASLPLPADDASGAVSDIPTRAIHARPLAGKRVLVIDDHPAALAQIGANLRNAGAQVESAASGEDAHRLLAACAGPAPPAAPPDAIVCDFKMPDVDGVTALRRIRDLLGERMPVSILMTKRGGQEIVDLSVAESIDDLVLKPVDSDVLVAKLDLLMRHAPDSPEASRLRLLRRRPAQAPQPQPYAARRALVVDDNPLNRDLVVAMLGKLGLSVHTAGNGAEALQRLLDHDFDIIFMDNQMPVMTGIDATRRIRALPTDKGRTPIIGLTGRSGDADRQEALDVGMNDYVVKPVSPARLLATIERWLRADALTSND